MCSDTLDISRNDKLKSVLNEYFDSQTVEETDDKLQTLDEPVSIDTTVFTLSIRTPQLLTIYVLKFEPV